MPIRVRPTLAVVALLLALPAALAALAQDDPGKATRPTPVERKVQRQAKALAFTPEREAAALTFVGRYHPELEALLRRLRTANREAYERAAVELFQVSEGLAELEARDPRRHAIERDAWVARSRVQVLVARLATEPAESLEGPLRAAVEEQVAVEIRRQRHDLELAEARARKAREAIDRLETNRDRLVESRTKSALKRGLRARKAGEGASAPAGPTGGRPARPPVEESP